MSKKAVNSDRPDERTRKEVSDINNKSRAIAPSVRNHSAQRRALGAHPC
jgi:hypothetical protein